MAVLPSSYLIKYAGKMRGPDTAISAALLI